MNKEIESQLRDWSQEIPELSEEHREAVAILSNYVTHKLDTGVPPAIQFICTHNSRRSQMAQAWSAAIADYFGLAVRSYSGGTEATQIAPLTLEALYECGFDVAEEDGDNAKTKVAWRPNSAGATLFSKRFDYSGNVSKKFLAVMTCSDADENCPVVPGAEERIPLTFEDPGKFDNTEEALDEYISTCLNIGYVLFLAYARAKELIND
jgi:arsenate reductase (thioredoxin)